MPELTQHQTEAEWQAEYDARSLAESEKIKNDPRRLERAQIAAARLAEKEKEEAKAMSKVAGSNRKPASGKGSGSSKPASGGIVKKTGFNVFEQI